MGNIPMKGEDFITLLLLLILTVRPLVVKVGMRAEGGGHPHKESDFFLSPPLALTTILQEASGWKHYYLVALINITHGVGETVHYLV